METPPHDRQLVGERVSQNERDLAVFLGAPAYFWTVGRVNGGIICDFISFHSGKGEVSVIRDSWSGEHKQGPSVFTSSTHHFMDFPCAFMCILEKQKTSVGMFSSARTVGYSTCHVSTVLYCPA